MCGVWFGGKHETLGWLTPLLLAPSEDTGTYREGGPITPSGVRLGGGRDRHRLAPSGAAPLLLRGGHSVGEAAGRERRLRRFRAPGEVLDEWPLDAALEVGPGGGPREIQTDPCTEPTRAVGSVNPSRHAAVVPGHAPRGLDELGAPGSARVRRFTRRSDLWVGWRSLAWATLISREQTCGCPARQRRAHVD